MAVFDMRDAVCDQMEGEFDTHMDTLRKAHELVGDQMDTLNDALDQITEPTEGVMDALNSLPDIPDLGADDTLGELQDMIKNCSWLGDSAQFSDPIKLMKGILGTAVGAAKGLIGALNIPEVSAGMLLDEIKDLLGVNGFNMQAVIAAMDKLLNCLSSVCGRDVQNNINEMQGMMDDLRLTDSGELDSGGILSDKGLTGDIADNINGAMDKAKAAQDSIESQVKGFKIPGL